MITMPPVTKENIVALVEMHMNKYSQKLEGRTTDLMGFGKPTNKIQCRFPKSKKKRIRKKWAKIHKNYKEVSDFYGEPPWMQFLEVERLYDSISYIQRAGSQMRRF